MQHTSLIARYKDRLSVSDNTKIISLGEGDTPLIRLCNIPKILKTSADIYVKCEGLNPTGSFKDRGMTMAVTKAFEGNKKAVVCASTGNTSASAAAYAARAGIKAFVLIPEGKIAMGKLAQAMMYGASIIQIEGNFDTAMRLVKKLSHESEIVIVNSINPYRLEGQKTAAFEIIEELGTAPDYHYLPVGNAANISAYWLGYKEYKKDGKIKNTPIMVGYQAEGAAPFLRAKMVDNPKTVATAIRIGHPQSWDLAQATRKESNGWFGEVSDSDILDAQKLLADKEGIFCEPASAASLAGVVADLKMNKISPNAKIVCTLTGNGLKDTDIAIKQCGKSAIMDIKPELSVIKRTILERIK